MSSLHSQESPTPSAGSKKSEVVPNKGKQNQKWLPHPCLLGGPKQGGNATSPLHSRGSPTKGNKIRSGCLTPYYYFFFGSGSRIEISVGRVSKKAQVA